MTPGQTRRMRRERASLIASAPEMTRYVVNSNTAQYTAKVVNGYAEYRERVAAPVMQAVDDMPSEFRALVNEFGYVDVYRAWRKGWSPVQIRRAVRDGTFAL